MADKEVRVRYAPSPTGLQHIGGVRTALLIICMLVQKAENLFFAWKTQTKLAMMKNM